MKVEEIPLENLTVGGLTELQRYGVEGIIDRDKEVLRIIREEEVDPLYKQTLCFSYSGWLFAVEEALIWESHAS